MGFIDGKQPDPGARQQAQEARRQQPLGCHVEQVQFALDQLTLDVEGAAGVQCRIEEGRAHAKLSHGRHLILHQRDQRRDHDAGTGTQQGGNLVAQRLAAAGGHQHQGIAAGDQLFDDLLLQAAEVVESEDAAKQLTRGFSCCLRHR